MYINVKKYSPREPSSDQDLLNSLTAVQQNQLFVQHFPFLTICILTSINIY